MILRLRNIQVQRPGGKGPYLYHRKTRARLDVDPDTGRRRTDAEIVAAWQAEEAKAAGLAPAPATDTFGALRAAYLASEEYRALRPATRETYRLLLDQLQPLDGVPLARLDAAELLKVRDRIKRKTEEKAIARAERSGRPMDETARAASGVRMANLTLATLGAVFAWGVPRRLCRANPAADVPRLRKPRGAPTRNRAWTWTEIEWALAGAPDGIGMAILLGLQGQGREADVIRMTRAADDGHRIEVRQQKTGRLTRVPAHRRLRERLTTLPEGQMHLVVGERGRPYATTDSFKGVFFRYIRELEEHCGVADGLTFHGLRHTVGANLADAGATTKEIQDVLGCSQQQAETYTRDRDRDLNAASGAAKLERHWN